MPSDQKTLLILTPGFPESERDTTCLPAQQQFVKSVQAEFTEVQIIILTLQYPEFPARYFWNHIRVISFGIRSGFYQKLRWTRVWRELTKIYKQTRIIGILSFWCTECSLLGTYFGRIYGLRHYSWILGQDARKNNISIRIMRPKPEELIAISDFLADEFYMNHRTRPLHIIPNGLDDRLFPETLVTRDIDILGAGSLIPLKQYDVFINVIVQVLEYFPALKTMICGKGPELQNLQSLIGKLGLQQQISLTGELPHHEVISLIQRSKIFLHPSSYEGFSGACIEALYAGAHVISFTKPMNYPISHWHVVKTISEMKEKICSLLKQESLDHKRVMAYPVSRTAKEVMKLFGN